VACRCLFVLLVLASLPALAAQGPPRQLDEEDLSIASFLDAVETAISKSDRAQWLNLLSESADRDQAVEFFQAMVPQGVTHVVVKERDRSPLIGTLPGEGYRLVTEVFIETGPRGRIATWRLDIRRPRGEDLASQPWRIIAEDRLASIEGLHRLSLRNEKQYTARDLVVGSIDFTLKLASGDVFVTETPEGVTGLILLGDGAMSFTPSPKEERGQLRLFSGAETLESPFTAAFIRLNPFEFEQHIATGVLEPATVDPRSFRRAQAVFEEEVSKSFSLDLSDLSRETWSLLPQLGDFVAEVKTRRFDEITYARSSGQSEDVTLFQRAKKKNISSYASEAKVASEGRFYDEDEQVEYDVIDYQVNTSFAPDRQWMDGQARMKIRVKSLAVGVLSLRLAETLNVSSVSSDELGRLLFLRVRNQNSIVVNLPSSVPRDYVMTMTIDYSGRMERQNTLEESVATEGQQRSPQPDEILNVPPEDKWLFSNRQFWYPQAPVTDYATATMRITVPAEYRVVGSGVPALGSPILSPSGRPNGSLSATFEFNATQPVRYLGFVASRLTRIDAGTVALNIVLPPPPQTPSGKPAVAKAPPAIPPVGTRNTIALTIDANKRQEPRARDMMGTAVELLQFYSGLIGDVPYDSLAIAVVEEESPGGHAPGYFVMINNPPPVSQLTFRGDPASFTGFPEFFLAHEMAHQWFGQAVGWKNYHEQWISEGFAQYFAAMYAKERRGEGAFRDVLRQFRRWSMDASEQGPVYLGYRLGHIRNEPRVFRALVYNKGAAVLHMLRRLVGDDAFFRGLRRFYAENRFKKAGTEDFQKAMEAESKRELDRFFQRWIYDTPVARLRFSSSVSGQELIARFEQVGDVFDIPVTVTVTYTDGKSAEFVVPVTEAIVEQRLPLSGTVRSVDVNQDNAALAVIDKR
jgi:Peptidase family M1 domain